jgi:hypothetical protein
MVVVYMKSFYGLLLFLVFLLSSPVWAQNDFTHEQHRLDLSRYRMNISGNLSLPMSYNRHQEFRLGLMLMPSYGIFLWDNLELRSSVSLRADYTFTPRRSEVPAPFFWDISSTVIYYFNTPWRMRPYVGAGLGVGLMNLNVLSIHVLLDIPVGLLVELNRDLAIDMGVPVRFRMSARSLVDFINFPVGFIGFRYFFH